MGKISGVIKLKEEGLGQDGRETRSWMKMIRVNRSNGC